jgi:hypothetical protein
MISRSARALIGAAAGIFVLGCVAPVHAAFYASIEIGIDPFLDSFFEGSVHPVNNPPNFLFGGPVVPNPGYLNNVTGGSDGGAVGNVNIAAVPFGTLQFVALAINVTDDAGVSHRLSSEDDPALADIVDDLNDSSSGYGYTAYAFNNVPLSYIGAAAALSAGESTYGGQPFDILVAENYPSPPPFVNTILIWGFDFSGEIDNQEDGITALNITDVGAIPEPNVAALLAILGSAILVRRRRRIVGSQA